MAAIRRAHSMTDTAQAPAISVGIKTSAVDKLALAGIVGPLTWATLVVIGTALEYGFLRRLGWEPLRDAQSYPRSLATGPYGWLQVASSLFFGGLEIAFAVGLHRGLTRGRGSPIGPALVGLFGAAMALWHLDTIPPGAEAGAPGFQQLLAFAFFAWALALPPAFLFTWWRLRADPWWRGYPRYVFGTGVFLVLLLGLAAFIPPSLHDLPYYVYLTVALAGLEVLAIRLWTVARQATVNSE